MIVGARRALRLSRRNRIVRRATVGPNWADWPRFPALPSTRSAVRAFPRSGRRRDQPKEPLRRRLDALWFRGFLALAGVSACAIHPSTPLCKKQTRYGVCLGLTSAHAPFAE